MMTNFKEKERHINAKRNDIKTILVIGSGPIIIGQAAEFDYAGTQACLALKERIPSYSCKFKSSDNHD